MNKELIAELVAALEEARRQLIYIDGRFPTGTTPTTIVRISYALDKVAKAKQGAQ